MQRLIESGEHVPGASSGGLRLRWLWPTPLVALTTVWSALASTAWGQGVGGLLPATGLTGGGGNFRSVVESVLPGAKSTVNTGLAWKINGSLGFSLGATDSVAGTNGGWDLFGQVTPSIGVTGDTRRLQVQLAYSPTLNFYAVGSGQTLFAQSLNASATATLWPEHLSLTVRGISSTGSRFGGAAVNSSFLSKDEAVTTTSFSASPNFTQRFGGWGTFTAGSTMTRSVQGSGTSGLNQIVTPSSQAATSSPGFGTTGNLTNYQEYASFVTGENLGRWQDSVNVTSQQSAGAAIYQGSTRSNYSNSLNYALNRTVTLVGTVGYDQVSYPAARYRLNEMSWNGGLRVTPNADSSIELRYGRTQGATDFIVNANYSPTPRTVIFVRYTNGVGTGLEDQQSLVSTTGVGVGGIFIDTATGAPVVANSAFGSQFGLSRTKRLSVSGALNLERDTFTLGLTNEERQQLTSSTSVFGVTTPSGTTTTTTTASFAWVRSLNPATTLSNQLSYSISNSGALFGNPGGSFNTISFASTLTRALTASVNGNIQYTYTERTGGGLRGVPSSFGGSSGQNAILVGLQKTF